MVCEVGHSEAPGAVVRISEAIQLLPPYSFMVWTDTILPSLFIFVPSIRLSGRTGQLCVYSYQLTGWKAAASEFSVPLSVHTGYGVHNKYRGPSLWRNVAVGVNVIPYPHHVPRVRLN